MHEGGKSIYSGQSKQLNSNIKHLFGKFKFSSWQMFKDAIVIKYLGCFQRFLKFEAFNRKKIIDEANKRFKDELDIKKILDKIRNSHAMLRALMTAKDRNMIKISKERVIDPDELQKPI